MNQHFAEWLTTSLRLQTTKVFLHTATQFAAAFLCN
jgi:hypothetical protein